MSSRGQRPTVTAERHAAVSRYTPASSDVAAPSVSYLLELGKCSEPVRTSKRSETYLWLAFRHVASLVVGISQSHHPASRSERDESRA